MLVSEQLQTLSCLAVDANKLTTNCQQKKCIKFDRPVTGVTLEPDGSYGLAPRYIEVTGKRGKKFNRLGFPIVPCYAVTFHSMQGVTLDKAVIDIGAKNFEKGQVYTALSRVCSINGIMLSDIDIPYIMG